MKRIKSFSPTNSGGKKFNSRSHIEAMYKNSVWVNYSKKFLEINVRCYCCGNLSQVTDHLAAHKGNVELFKKNDNHIPLCFKCHNTATSLFDRFYTPKTKEKLEWLARCRSKNNLSFKVYVIPYG